MIEIRITAPELSEALMALADAMKFSGTPFSVPAVELNTEPERPADPAAEPAKKTRKKAKAENPTVSSEEDSAQTRTTAQPASADALPWEEAQPAASSAPAGKTYTYDDISNAGTALIDDGKLNELMGVLAKYNAETIFDIPTEQLPALAADLRALGAKI